MSIPKSMARVRAATLPGSRDRSQDTIESREDCVRKDLTLRMKCVCTNFSSVDFEALVKDMTREQLRGERVPTSRLPRC